MMNEYKTDWENLYQNDFMPWDTGRPSSHLMKLVEQTPINPCRVLDIGCGTGSSAIWLAQQSFRVVATDISKTALRLAYDKPDSIKCEFILADFIKDPGPGTDFEFVFDMGCFHLFDDPEQRGLFAQKVSNCLIENGLWLSICGSCDGIEIGPPRRSAREIIQAVEPCFEILSLTATELDELSASEMEALGLPAGTRPRAWACLMHKRGPETD